MQSVRKYMDQTIEYFAMTLLCIMLVIALWQIVSRYIFKAPITFSEECLRYMLIWLSLVGIAYGVGKSEHIALNIIKNIPPQMTAQLNLLTQIILIIFAVAVMLIGGIQAVTVSWSQVSSVLQISMGWIYLALPVGGVLVVIYSLLNILDILHGYRTITFIQDNTATSLNTHNE